MMKLRAKRKKSVAETKQNILPKGIHAGYKYLQGSWANWMRMHTKHFSHFTWIVLLILFILSTSTYSVYLAVSAFTKKGSNSFSITPIKKLEHTTETGETPLEAAEISEAEYNHIKKFRMYMDSLVRSPSGKMVYDSITGHRPGLMDSVRFIEIYYQKLKQK